jgi:hypothetical protein
VQVPLDLSKVFNQIQTITDTYKILENKPIEPKINSEINYRCQPEHHPNQA